MAYDNKSDGPPRQDRKRFSRPRRRKECIFSKDKNLVIDYKDQKLLVLFTNEKGKILPRRRTGTRAKFQRKVAKAIRRARAMGMMDFYRRG